VIYSVMSQSGAIVMTVIQSEGILITLTPCGTQSEKLEVKSIGKVSE